MPGCPTRITDRRKELLRQAHAYQELHHRTPTVRTLCELLGLHSTNGVQEHLVALEQLGYVRRDAARGFVLLRGADGEPVR